MSQPTDKGPSTALDPVIQRHKDGHEKDGTTFAYYFPPDCPWEVMESVTNAMMELAFDAPGDGWDVSAWGHGGECDLGPVSPDKPRSTEAGS
jgi:hypothetical protein